MELILNLIEHGQTIPQIMNDYDLTEDQVKSAIRYATKRVDTEHRKTTTQGYYIIKT